jgi:hypothetical protein
MRRALFVLPGLSLLALGLTMIAWAQPQASPADVAKLISQDAKYIQDTLAKPTVDKKSQRRVRIAAMLIAQYAQGGLAKDNPKNASLATLRDKALGIIKAVDADKLADAKKLADALSPDIKAEGVVNVDFVPLNKSLEFEAVMRAFSSERVGGFGLENQLEELVELKGPVDAEKAEKIQTLALKVAQIAHLAHAYVPEKDDGKKTKKAWLEDAKEMQAAAMALAEAGKGKQDVAIAKAAQNLSGTCIKCHDIFR